MKIKPKQYAEFLYEMLGGKRKSQVRDEVKKFLNVLQKNNGVSKIEKIIEEFIKLWNKEKKIVEAEIVSARDLNKDIVKLLNGYIVKITKAKEVELTKRVDKSILGGVVIRYGDKVLEGSVRARLDDLKIKMIR